jgi:hypothetical protein
VRLSLGAVLTVAVIGSAGVSIASAREGAPSHVRTGPVSYPLLRFLRAYGPESFSVAGARPGLGKATAVRDALRLSPWRLVSDRGITLVKVTRSRRQGIISTGKLVWLVSLKPHHRVYEPQLPCCKPALAASLVRGPAADFFVVLIDARNGHLLEAVDGYTASLGPASHGPDWMVITLR